jgi:ATP-binding cassette, subfamily F, member 3
MLTAHNLKKSFDSKILFDNISFSLNPGERMGLVGPNGCGKTTLLRILAGAEAPTGGHISRDPHLRTGYLPQGFEPDPADTISAIVGRTAGDPAALESELAAAAGALAACPDNPSLSDAYDDLLRRIELAETGRTADILAGLGLDGIDPNLPARYLSGGQKTRLALALILLNDPQLLLLDEPTNHLDIGMLEWLEEWLTDSPCATLIVSHDRTFLDHTVTRILEMEPRPNHGEVISRVSEYSGNYSDYLAQREAEIEKQWSTFNDQQMEIGRMEKDVARVKAQAAQAEKAVRTLNKSGSKMPSDVRSKGFKSHERRMAKKVAKKATSREKKLERYLEDDERVERPQRATQIKIAFDETPHLGRSVIQLSNLSVGYDPAAPLLRDLRLQVEARQRVVISGPNGSGKTTLLRSLAGQLAPLAGEVRLGPTVRLGYITQDQSGLDPTHSALEAVQHAFTNPTQARSFLASFLFRGDEALKPISLLSYGQRARLALARLVAESCNCLLLDEPINHLDIASREQFEQALVQFNGAILAVVHDRYFIERFADIIWWVEGGSVDVRVMR